MNFKSLIIELFQASSFAAILAFLFATIGQENIEDIIRFPVGAFFLVAYQ